MFKNVINFFSVIYLSITSICFFKWSVFCEQTLTAALDKKETYNGNVFEYYNNLNFSNKIDYCYHSRFPNLDSEILLYLSMWQYWWWFWFVFLTVFYYILIFRIFFMRQQKMNPRINTSLKSHGKWGDLIVGIIPIYWCLNILTNSNTLLKMLEWQTESHILILRIRGKQWYWVYKLDLQNFNHVLYLNKNIGRNNYLDDSLLKSYYSTLTSYVNNTYYKKYYTKDVFNFKIPSKTNYLIERGSNYFNFLNTNLNWVFDNIGFKVNRNNNYYNIDYLNSYLRVFNRFIKKNLLLKLKKLKVNKSLLNKTDQDFIFFKKKGQFLKSNISINKKKIIFFNFYKNLMDVFNKNTSDSFFKHFEINQYCKPSFLKKRANLNFIDGNLSGYFFQNSFRQFNYNYNFVIKNIKIDWMSKNKGSINNVFTKKNDYTIQFKKYNNSKSDLNSRLLKLKHVLVLPGATNISVITNSFDVVHSWFVPGIGIKMDCVPGRATHHTFYFDTYGLFLGQCAEVCGRFHHHMPIKVALVRYELFIVWFSHIFLKKTLKKK